MPDADRFLRRVKLSDLRLLQAVVERGGMSKAAVYLNLSQPAVSKAIASLEQALGVRLLDRTPKGMEPTMFGRALLSGGVAVFDELRQSLAHIEYLSDPHQGLIRIGCSEAGAAGFVPAAIDQFSAHRPRVDFQIITADPASLIERELPQRLVELAICAVPNTYSSQLEVTHLFDDRHVIVASKQSKWGRARRVKLPDLVKEPWVLPPAWSEPGRLAMEAFRKAGVEAPARSVASFSISLSVHMLATGRYIALLPEVMSRLSDHLPLKMLPVDFPAIKRPVSVVTLKGRSISPVAKQFIDFACDIAAKLRLEVA